ncbi:hemimethylated DNA-binding domain protein [Ceratobasidium sp. AG-Ba]|nr:hemimethylated DNA-binding domain protein [Ceratobasidium sp. AG-Ba]
MAGQELTPWYKIYCQRRINDIRILSLLDTVIKSPSKRDDAAVALCEYYELAWDMLRTQATCRVPDTVKDIWKEEEEIWAGEIWEGPGEE